MAQILMCRRNGPGELGRFGLHTVRNHPSNAQQTCRYGGFNPRGPAPEGGTDAPVLAVSELTVDSEATLTVGTSDNPLQLRVPLTKSDDMDSMDDFTVKGTTTGTGAVWIAHLATTDEQSANRDCFADPVVPGFLLHESYDYMHDAMNKVNHEDCVMITGGGRILNDVYAVAAGHVSVDLGTIGSLTVVGSLGETPRTITLADGRRGMLPNSRQYQ